MSAFKRLVHGPQLHAPRVIEVLPPSAFSDDWERKPREPMRIGLCFISEEANTKAMKLAASNAWDDFPEPKDEDLRIEALNDYLITNVLARACVHESDSSKLFFATAPEALIRVALTAGGIRRLWMAYERMVLLDGPLSPELDLEELPMLQEKLATMATLEGQRATRAKRLAQALLNELSSG